MSLVGFVYVKVCCFRVDYSSKIRYNHPLMADIKPPSSIKDFPLTLVKNMMTLAASGFGVVVALAWNEFIKGFVAVYIDPYFGKNSGMISLFIYASVITVVAVLVTMQLSLVQKKLEAIQERAAQRKLPSPALRK